MQQLEFDNWRSELKARDGAACKANFGHVLVVGGDYGMPGAVRIVGEGALRMGAGLVTIVTHSAHIAAVVSGRPELLCYGIDDDFNILESLLSRASVVVIGPGLGQSAWSKRLFERVMETDLPKVVDADGLNLLASCSYVQNNWVLTPHPGEAGRLLGISSTKVQQDRLQSVCDLQAKYSGCVVLKGQGSLVCNGPEQLWCCSYGNPGMATAGMGDLLSGMIAGLIAQGVASTLAARLGVYVHARAGDLAMKHGIFSVLALDVAEYIGAV